MLLYVVCVAYLEHASAACVVGGLHHEGVIAFCSLYYGDSFVNGHNLSASWCKKAILAHEVTKLVLVCHDVYHVTGIAW